MDETYIILTLPRNLIITIIESLVKNGDYIKACKVIMEAYKLSLPEAVQFYKSLAVYQDKK